MEWSKRKIRLFISRRGKRWKEMKETGNKQEGIEKSRKKWYSYLRNEKNEKSENKSKKWEEMKAYDLFKNKNLGPSKINST